VGAQTLPWADEGPRAGCVEMVAVLVHREPRSVGLEGGAVYSR
jgi:hypothetical protein